MITYMTFLMCNLISIVFVPVLTYMINDMTKFIHQYHEQIFPSVWQLLTQMAEIYVKVVVNENSSSLTENATDDDELTNFNTLIAQVYEFIHSTVEHYRFKSIIQNVLTDLIYISIIYMQITEEQIAAWDDDAETYIDDFNGCDVGDYSVRTTSSELLQTLADEFEEVDLLPAYSEALKRHLQVAVAEKNAANPNWWKLNEAAIMAFNSIKRLFKPDNPEANNNFNVREYLAYVRSMLGAGENGSGYQNDVSPYLHSRALWTLAAFSYIAPDIYDRAQLQSILDSMANNMSNDKPMAVQVCAFKTLQELCQNLKNTIDQRNMVTEKLPVFLAFITDIGSRAKPAVLYDLMTAISAVVSVIHV